MFFSNFSNRISSKFSSFSLRPCPACFRPNKNSISISSPPSPPSPPPHHHIINNYNNNNNNNYNIPSRRTFFSWFRLPDHSNEKFYEHVEQISSTFHKKCPYYLFARPGIYKLSNNRNGKIYVGLSLNMQRRIRNHLLDAFNFKYYYLHASQEKKTDKKAPILNFSKGPRKVFPKQDFVVSLDDDDDDDDHSIDDASEIEKIIQVQESDPTNASAPSTDILVNKRKKLTKFYRASDIIYDDDDDDDEDEDDEENDRDYKRYLAKREKEHYDYILFHQKSIAESNKRIEQQHFFQNVSREEQELEQLEFEQEIENQKNWEQKRGFASSSPSYSSASTSHAAPSAPPHPPPPPPPPFFQTTKFDKQSRRSESFSLVSKAIARADFDFSFSVLDSLAPRRHMSVLDQENLKRLLKTKEDYWIETLHSFRSDVGYNIQRSRRFRNHLADIKQK